jgi:hypothetical protein
MNNYTTDRFEILIGKEEYANHIIDMAADSPDEESFLSINFSIPGEMMCSHGHKLYGTELVSLSEYATKQGIDNIDLEGDAPKGICSYCWSNTQTMLDEEAEHDVEGVYDRIGTVGYRLRWKQKGRAREEWYDLVVRPETTMAELDTLVCRFSTLDDLHLRMYGLEDEYLDSSINIVPDHQHSRPSHTMASERTIAEVATHATLWEGDRLSLVYDFGTPAHYYCIVKEVYDPEEIDTLLAENDPITETDTAAIINQK